MTETLHLYGDQITWRSEHRARLFIRYACEVAKDPECKKFPSRGKINYTLDKTQATCEPCKLAIETLCPTGAKEKTMAKAKKSKKASASKGPIGTNETTGFRVGSIGDRIGEAYLSSDTHEEAIAKAEKIMRDVHTKKGKSTAQEAVHARAVSWVGFLPQHSPKLYKELPSAEKKTKKEAAASAA